MICNNNSFNKILYLLGGNWKKTYFHFTSACFVENGMRILQGWIQTEFVVLRIITNLKYDYIHTLLTWFSILVWSHNPWKWSKLIRLLSVSYLPLWTLILFPEVRLVVKLLRKRLEATLDNIVLSDYPRYCSYRLISMKYVVTAALKNSEKIPSCKFKIKSSIAL